MEIIGKAIAALPVKSGVSQRTGEQWQSREYVIETQEQYPKKICFEVFGTDKLKEFNIRNNDLIKVYFDISAREYNGKWYLFHHDSVPSGGKSWLRSLKVCEIEYDADGKIMTIDGID